MTCNAQSTWKQMLSLSMKLFSQLLDNVILPASPHFPQEIAYGYLQLMKTSPNTLFHEKQTVPVLPLFVTNAKCNLKSISAGQHRGFLHAVTHRHGKASQNTWNNIAPALKVLQRVGCKPLDPTACLRTPRFVRHHI